MFDAVQESAANADGAATAQAQAGHCPVGTILYEMLAGSRLFPTTEAPSGGLPDATNPSYVPSRLRALSSASEQEQSTQSRGWGRWGLGKFGRAERPGICWRRCWSPAPTAVSRHRRQRVSQCKLADRFNL
eukprot:s7386_g1.t1